MPRRSVAPLAQPLHQCPVCREPLVALELRGVEIDYCPTCGGTWLDPGELEQITHLAGVAPDRLSRALRETRNLNPSARACPRCARRLREVSVGEHPAVRLDRCPRGHGLWFDRGEMKTVIAQFEAPQSGAPPSGPDECGAVARFFAELFRYELEKPQ